MCLKSKAFYGVLGEKLFFLNKTGIRELKALKFGSSTHRSGTHSLLFPQTKMIIKAK